MDLPKPITLPQFTDPSGQTYTDILNETLGPAGTPSDGFDSAMQNLIGISGAFGVELNADPLGGHLGAAGAALGGVDPASLDGHMDGYTGTKEYAFGIVAAAGAVIEPQLLTLPLTPGDGSTAFIPPRQVTHDFGTVKLNSAAKGIELGKYVETALGGDVGDYPKGFVIDAPVFQVWYIYKDNAAGTETHVRFGITMTPFVAGEFTAQFEYVDGGNRQLVILTLTVNVTP